MKEANNLESFRELESKNCMDGSLICNLWDALTKNHKTRRKLAQCYILSILYDDCVQLIGQPQVHSRFYPPLGLDLYMPSLQLSYAYDLVHTETSCLTLRGELNLCQKVDFFHQVQCYHQLYDKENQMLEFLIYKSKIPRRQVDTYSAASGLEW